MNFVLIWLVILSVLYAIQAAFAVNAQKQINELNIELGGQHRSYKASAEIRNNLSIIISIVAIIISIYRLTQ